MWILHPLWGRFRFLHRIRCIFLKEGLFSYLLFLFLMDNIIMSYGATLLLIYLFQHWLLKWNYLNYLYQSCTSVGIYLVELSFQHHVIVCIYLNMVWDMRWGKRFVSLNQGQQKNPYSNIRHNIKHVSLSK